MTDDTKTLLIAAGLGAVAGMRSMLAPALLSHRLAARPAWRRALPGQPRIVRWMADERVAQALALAAVGEAAADKTPWVPARTEPPAVLGRALSGAFCGAVVAGGRGALCWGAAAVGAGAALASTFAAYHARRAAGEASDVPDAALAVVEDAIAVSAGHALVQHV